MPDLPLFPEAASTLAHRVDGVYIAWVVISVFFALLIAVLVLLFFTRFRRSDERPVGRPMQASTVPLEVTWSVIPLIIALTMFTWGAKVFIDASRPPADAVDFYGIGKQWMWKFQHPGGVREINDLHIPVGQPIRMTLTSQDVIHSLYLPAFRVKADAVPGRYTTIWFEATKTGEYHLFCAEYCGSEHSKMGGTVHVMEPEAYEEWLATGYTGPTMLASGSELFEQLTCNTCHQVGDPAPGGMPARGPDLAGLYGTEVQLADGSTVVVDESYLRESILNPQAKIVAGWQPIMPTFRGQVTEEQLNELVSYLKNLGGTRTAGSHQAPGTPGDETKEGESR